MNMSRVQTTTTMLPRVDRDVRGEKKISERHFCLPDSKVFGDNGFESRRSSKNKNKVCIQKFLLENDPKKKQN
jgi:hypothetical protein